MKNIKNNKNKIKNLMDVLNSQTDIVKGKKLVNLKIDLKKLFKISVG